MVENRVQQPSLILVQSFVIIGNCALVSKSIAINNDPWNSPFTWQG